jgi:hypothetical protein
MRVTRRGTRLRQPVLSTVEGQVSCTVGGCSGPLQDAWPRAQIAQLCTHHSDAVTLHLAAPNGGNARGCRETGDHALQRQTSALPVGTSGSRGARSLKPGDALAGNPVAVAPVPTYLIAADPDVHTKRNDA